MSTEELREEVLALPLQEQKNLFNVLWESIDSAESPEDPAFLAELQRRSDEMDRDPSIGIPLEEVFAELRQRTGCK